VTIAIGTQLGSHEITALLGKGGMGEVYRARDLKLKREVAIKILPEEFSRDADRVSRFQREAEVLASLNHANIAAIYDLAEANGARYLVLELVEGETLTDRIARGSIPLEEALDIAKQIAEALETAHERGIIHRDLKPANVKLTQEGKVKVLDFGLAKAMENGPFGLNLSNSPTLLSAVTNAGVILGTAAYMSPEQAKGLTVDRRSDIWAFGVVLFEMLTGKGPFVGNTIADILASVLRTEPELKALPASTPASILRLVKRCLEKDRKKRLPDIGVARLEIDEAADPEQTVTERATKRRYLVPWIVTALALLVLFFGSWYDLRIQPESHWVGTRLGGPAVAFTPRISPDGQLLAFLAMVDGLTQLAVMKPDTGNWTVLTHDRSRGGIVNICWSRDGARLYFDRLTDRPRGIFSVPVLGGDDQLVVEDAGDPEALSDGSLLRSRLNSERLQQLHRFWPDSGRLQPFKVLLTNNYRVTPGGDQVVFIGKPFDDPSARPHLYVMELGSEKTLKLASDLKLAPDVSFVTQLVGNFPLAASSDGKSVLVVIPADDAQRIVSVPLDGSNKLHTLMTLTKAITYFDVGNDGSVYLDQGERPGKVLRVARDGGTPEHIVAMTLPGNANVLPLADGRLLVNSRTGRDHILLVNRGRELTPFVETQEETAMPAALLGQTQVAFMIGAKSSRTIAVASLQDRRIIRRLDGSKGTVIDSLASPPDGKTIFYAASGFIWTIPANDGQPQKVRKGDSVTVDPYKKELIIRLTEAEGTRLVRQPIAGGAERPIVLQGEMRVAPIFMQSNAVGKDGSILAQVSSPGSWFWPLAAIHPDTGHMQVIRIGYDADMVGGWTQDGKIMVGAMAMRASLWHFRPESAARK
jgi:hypothetical protein